MGNPLNQLRTVSYRSFLFLRGWLHPALPVEGATRAPAIAKGR
jgi:hypothetical protein